MKSPVQRPFSFISFVLCSWILALTNNARATVFYFDPGGTTAETGTSNYYNFSLTTPQWVSNNSALSASLYAWQNVITTTNAVCFGAGSYTGTNVIVLTNPTTFAGIFNGPLNPPGQTLIITTNSAFPNGAWVLPGGTASALATGGSDGDPSTINAPITGTGQLEPEDGNQCYLNGSNSYTGGTILDQTGILNFNNGSAFGTGTITMLATGGALAVEGSSPITITNAVTAASVNLNIVANPAGLTFGGNWSLGSTTPSIGAGGTSGTANQVIISGIISGTGGLKVYNTNILELTGANTFTGAMSITNAIVIIGGAGKLNAGSYAGTITLNSGATFAYDSSSAQTLSAVISGTGQVIQEGTGALTLSAAETYSGNTTISSGTLKTGASSTIPSGTGKGNLIITGSGVLDLDSHSGTINALSGNGTIDVSGGTAGTVYNLTISPQGTSNVFTGTIQNTLGSAFVGLALSGSGTEYLTGNNTFSGGITNKGGQIWINNSSALGAAPSGGTKWVEMQDQTGTFAELHLQGTNGPIVLPSSIQFVTGNPSPNGAIVNEAGNNVINGNIGLTSGGSTLLAVNGGTLTLAGTISISNQSSRSLILGGVGNGTITGPIVNGVYTGTGLGLSLIKSNLDTWVLDGTNTYGDETVVLAGVLSLGADASISNSPSINIDANAGFDVSQISTFDLSTNTALNIAGTNAFINGAVGGSVNLGAQPINVDFVPTSFAGDLTHPSLYISNAAVTLNSNTITLTNGSGTPLGAGNYNLIQVGDGVTGTISGAPNSNVVVLGSGIASGLSASLAITNSTLELVVATAVNPTYTILTQQAAITYGQSTNYMVTVSPVPDGGYVQFFVNGAAFGAPVAVDTTTGFASSIFTATNLAAATYTIGATYYGSLDNQYGGGSALTISQVVSQEPLTITASNQSTTYGALITTSGSTQFTATGLVNNETIGSVTLAVTSAGNGANAGTTNETVGTYKINPSAAAGGSGTEANYAITYVTGTLTVNPQPLTITSTSFTKPYGSNDTTTVGSLLGAGFTASGLVNAQTAAAITVTMSSAGAVSNAPVYGSPYQIVINSAAELSASTNFPATNYSITYVNGNITVSPLAVHLTGSQPYNGTDLITGNNLSVSNKLTSDSVYVAEGISVVNGINPGTYAFASLFTEILGNAGGQGTGTGVGTSAQFNAPTGVCVDTNNNLYVADTANNRVCEINTNGVQTVVPFTGLSNPVGVAVDVFSNIYVADPSLNAVFEMQAGGSQVTVPLTGLNYPTSVAVDSTGDLFVTDTLNNRVLELPVGGSQTVLTKFTVTDPAGIAVDAGGDVFVVNAGGNDIVEVPAGGTQIILSALTNKYSFPASLAVDANTNLYLAAYGTASINILSLSNGTPGTVTTVSSFTDLNQCEGVAVDANGDIFASVPSLNFVEELTCTNAASLSYETPIVSIGTLTSNNYTLTGAATTGLVTNTAAAPVFANLAGAIVTYGTSNVTLTGSITGPPPFSLSVPNGTVIGVFVNGVKETTTVASGAFSLNYKMTNLPVGSYTVTYSNASSTDFASAVNTSTTLTVDPLAVILNGSRQYDATNDAAAGILLVSNVQGPDSVNVASGSGTLASGNVGVETFGSFGTLALGGASSSNYTLVGAGGSVTVTSAVLTVTASNESMIYGATVPPLAYGISGFIGNDTTNSITGAPVLSTATNAAVGSYTITNSTGSLSALNYVFTTVNGLLSVGQATLTPAVTVQPSKPYDGTTAAVITGSSVTGYVNGDSATTVNLGSSGVASYSDPNVGNNKIVTITGLSLSGSSAGDYVLSTTTVIDTANITPATVSITSGLSANNKVYDGTNTATLTWGSLTYSGFASGDTSVSLETNGYVATFDSNNVATNISVTVLDLSLTNGDYTNYVLASPALTADITPATLTYVATETNQDYGSDNTNFSGTVTGFIDNDNITNATSGTLAFASATTATSPLGTYAITGSGLTASNYVFAQADGNATALTIILGGGTPYPDPITNNSTFSYTNSGSQVVSGSISGSGSLTVSGSGTLTLTGANTYTGSTSINSGTLALGNGGSISNTSSVTIGSGGTLDVSGQGSSTFVMPGTNFTASGDAPAVIIGPVGGFVSLSSMPITLTNDGVAPSLFISNSTLVLDGNVFTIDTFTGLPLAAGSYVVVEQDSGDISGTVTSAVSGTAIPATGTTNYVEISGGDVLLNILNITTNVLSGGAPINYGSPLNITSTVTPAPPDGESVVFYAGATAISTNSLTDGAATLSISTLPPGTYSITAVYSGDDANTASTSTALSQIVNVNPSSPTLNFSVAGNQLTVSWPSANLGWTLQTNATDLTTNSTWYAYPGSTTSTNATITIAPSQPAVYFRLMAQ